jgi:hypothetical protein
MTVIDFSRRLTPYELRDMTASYRYKLSGVETSPVLRKQTSDIIDALNCIDALTETSDELYLLAGYHAEQLNAAVIKGDFSRAYDLTQRIIEGQERFLTPLKRVA